MKLFTLRSTFCSAAVIFAFLFFVVPCATAQDAAARPIPMTTIVPNGKPHKFEAKDHQFLIDGQPTLLVSGEMHFGRILPEDFETRVKQAKAMGLNTISFYLFWNLAEPEEGKFDFTGMNDVRRMFKLCQDNGMWVILRPGPYCCAEVEYGGIPYWTLKYPNVKIRTNDPTYVEWSRKYIEQVYKQVADFQVGRGGPLLMVQIENEYGMVAGGNYDYMHSLRQIFKDVGFETQLFACDPFIGGFGRGGGGARGGAPSTQPAPAAPNPYGDDILRGRNGLRAERDYTSTVAAIGDFPPYAPEVYTAWFSGWGQPIATRYAALDQTVSWTKFLLDHQCSWCYYMFFGGTNWGYSNGCNEYMPVQTSYNYGAPIDEAGRTTEKFRALRTMLSERLNVHPPEPPADPKIVELPAISFSEKTPLVDWMGNKPTSSTAKPTAMEDLNQAYGFVLYRKKFPDGIKGKLELRQAMDYAVTMVNGKTVGRSFIGFGPESNTITLDEAGPATLDILVYNLGRVSVIVNAAASARAHKGLIGGAFLDGKELTDWDNYSLPMSDVGHFTASSSAVAQTGPELYQATFNVDQPAGTFLDMRNWGFGVVWVNGHNLGRFWDRGGLRSLFLPAAFLKAGSNQITILELQDAPKVAQVSGVTQIIEAPAEPFVMKLDQRVPAKVVARGR